MIRRYRPEDLEVVVVCFTRSVRTIGARDYAREEIAAWAPDPPDMSGWPARLASGGSSSPSWTERSPDSFG